MTFIPGDGTGPELTEATRRVLEATGVDFNWDRHEAGIDEYRKHGNPLAQATLASLRRTGGAELGAHVRDERRHLDQADQRVRLEWIVRHAFDWTT